MLKFLSVTRRILLAGTLSLFAILIMFIVGYPGLSYTGSKAIGTGYLFFALASPVLGLIFWLISTAYVRKKGQSAAYQQTVKFTNTMGQMFRSDITSPFSLIREQFVSKKKLVEYYNQVAETEIAEMLADGSRAMNRLKLIRMIIRFAIYIIGSLTAVSVLYSVH